MKTIRQALIDEIHYPLSEGYVDNKLLSRGLTPDYECDSEVMNSKEFKGAVADSLISLIAAPNFSEADKNISMADKSNILKWANNIYKSIGEDEVSIGTPSVFVGDFLL